MTVRFDEYEADPIQGDPDQLLQEWQENLTLRIDEKGEILMIR